MRIRDETDKQNKQDKTKKRWQGKLLWVAAWNERGVCVENKAGNVKLNILARLSHHCCPSLQSSSCWHLHITLKRRK